MLLRWIDANGRMIQSYLCLLQLAGAPYKMLVIRINCIVIVMVILSMEHVYMNICVPHVWHKSVLCEFYYTKINFIMLSKYDNISNKNGAGHFDGVRKASWNFNEITTALSACFIRICKCSESSELKSVDDCFKWLYTKHICNLIWSPFDECQAIYLNHICIIGSV